MPSSRQHLGRWGEDKAAAWYSQHGWEILDRNWRYGRGEIDLVVRRGPVLVFCEVKTRSSHAMGSPAEAVDVQKQRKLRALASQWLAQNAIGTPQIRFDVACVDRGRVEVLKGAF